MSSLTAGAGRPQPEPARQSAQALRVSIADTGEGAQQQGLGMAASTEAQPDEAVGDPGTGTDPDWVFVAQGIHRPQPLRSGDQSQRAVAGAQELAPGGRDGANRAGSGHAHCDSAGNALQAQDQPRRQQPRRCGYGSEARGRAQRDVNPAEPAGG